MKFATISAILGLAAATQHHPAAHKMAQTKDDGNDADTHLSQLITSALAGAPPGEINEPVHVDADVEGATQVTQGHTRNYQFHWEYACAFTKWTPTNQFLHEQVTNNGPVYDADTMTLERFGFIGQSKKCYWGMIGVEWVTPLKVEQIRPTA